MAPNRTYTPPEASVAQLRALRTQLGVARNVIVQPSFYGFDNSCLVDALAELGTSARGVAVVPVDVTDTELQRLASRGVTGVRLNLGTAGIRDPKVAADAAHAFATRFVPLGWHIQINTELPVIEGLAPMIADIKVPVVFALPLALLPPLGTSLRSFQQSRRRKELKGRFGTEYDRTIETAEPG